MADEALRLIEPDLSMRDAFIDYAEEFEAADEPYAGDDLKRAREDFAAYVQRRRDWAAGRKLPRGFVPFTAYWLVHRGRIIGRSRLRHYLNARLTQRGGHVGYEIRPSERGKGYATRLLARTLDKAREIGLERALVTCDRDNAASARVIEKNGGVFANAIIAPDNGRPTRRYWIDL
ncbi:MAG: GNAT family N-acetyltransferase [Planctomycetota bacterium]